MRPHGQNHAKKAMNRCPKTRSDPQDPQHETRAHRGSYLQLQTQVSDGAHGQQGGTRSQRVQVSERVVW